MHRRVPLPDLVDLHVHSSVSDGIYRPREVVRRAAEVGLKALAISDHDTVAGVPEAVGAGEEFGVEVIPAVEISAEFDGGACHILGYFINPLNEGLRDLSREARRSRAERTVKILERLEALDIPLSLEDVQARSEDCVTTRAHFASALIEKGYAKTWEEAFAKYLGCGKPAYVYRRRVEPEKIIRVLHGAGGLAVLAHPRQMKRSLAETDEWIAHLADAGLDGIETQSPDHGEDLARHYRAAAERLGLVETGGTDWHGHKTSPLVLGIGHGTMRIPYAVVEKMKERLAGRGTSSSSRPDA